MGPCQPSNLASSPENSDQNVPSGSSTQYPRSDQNQRNKNNASPFGYGSETSSDESDDDYFPPTFFPRVLMSVLETPIDDGGDSMVFDQPTAGEPVFAADSALATDPASGDLVSPNTTDQPWSLYDFHWKTFPNPPIEPESRREKFSESNVGPTTPCVYPYDIFIAIWDRQIMEHIVFETNRYAQQVTTEMLDNRNLHPNSRIDKWSDTTVDELYTYFGLIIAMGVLIKSDIEEYWTSIPGILWTLSFSPYMSFMLLSKCLHFNNNEDMCALKLDEKEAIIFKIQPVLSHLNLKFQSLYNLGQNICLDETLLQWKGRFFSDQSSPDKAVKVGIKSYEISEARTGYLWRFEVFLIHLHLSSLKI